MSFFDFLLGNPKPKKRRKTPNHNPLAISPSKKDLIVYFENFEQVFKKEMAQITAFSKQEIKDMHTFIAKGDGYRNQHRWHKTIYERYFKDREWIWPEFDDLIMVFSDIDEGFYPCWPIVEIGIETALEYLTEQEIREFYTIHSIYYDKNANKTALIHLAKKQPEVIQNLSNYSAWINIVNESIANRRFFVYDALMRTIYFRADNLTEKNRRLELGLTKASWLFTEACGQGHGAYPGHKEADGKNFDINQGLKINGKFVYPGDLIFCICSSLTIIPGLNDKTKK